MKAREAARMAMVKDGEGEDGTDAMNIIRYMASGCGEIGQK